MGLGDSATGNSYFTDRTLTLEGNGAVTFNANGVSVTSSTTGYNNGAWHMAAASLGPSGMRVYVDGALRASNAGTTTGQNYTGFWRLGGDNVYFPGSLDEAAVFLSELTAARVLAHYTAGTAATSLATYTSTVTADSPWALWHLDDAPLTATRGSSFATTMADSSAPTIPAPTLLYDLMLWWPAVPACYGIPRALRPR